MRRTGVLGYTEGGYTGPDRRRSNPPLQLPSRLPEHDESADVRIANPHCPPFFIVHNAAFDTVIAPFVRALAEAVSIGCT